MERLEFIEKIFTLYRVNPENNKELVLIYDNAFSCAKPVDWDRLFKRILNTAEGGLPKPAFFVSQFDSCLKNENYTTAEGLRLRINFKDGYNYEFETYKTNETLPDLKKDFMRYFRGAFQNMQLFDETKLEWVTI